MLYNYPTAFIVWPRFNQINPTIYTIFLISYADTHLSRIP